jgi:hypothetical protein
MPPRGPILTATPPSMLRAWSRLRGPIASVGEGVCQYGPTNGYATPNGVTGYVGPPASALQTPINWYVRTGGSNSNGGTTASLSPIRSGSDASTTAGLNTVTSSSAAFTSADIGQGINVAFATRRIVSITSSTVAVCDRAFVNSGSSQAWRIGGAWADVRMAIGDVAATDGSFPVSSGDTVYIGAGTYRVTMAASSSAPSSYTYPAFNGQVNIVGDVTGQYTGDAGMVQLTAYTTNDKTAPSSTALLNLNGKSNMSFSNIMFVGGNANALVTATTLTSQNITFRDCAFMQNTTGGIRAWNVTCGYQVPANWLIDRCYSLNLNSGGAGLLLTLTTGNASNDFDANFVVQNSAFINQSTTGPFVVSNSGTLTFKGGGLKIRNVLAISGSSILTTVANQNSTIFPCLIYNCMLATGNQTTLNAGTNGQIVEDYNLIYATTPRTNVTVGAHSISDGSYVGLIHFGQERIWGGLPRPFGEPLLNSPLLGFGNDGSQTPYDMYNRPRPAGGGALPYPAVGALERSNTPTQATSPVPPQGTNIWQFTGPGYQDFLLPVSAVSNGLSFQVRRDAAYSPYPGGTNPAMLILANPRIGVSAQTIVDTGSSGAWNTLTASTFTPTGNGWVTVRIISYDGTGASVVSFADFVDV